MTSVLTEILFTRFRNHLNTSTYDSKLMDVITSDDTVETILLKVIVCGEPGVGKRTIQENLLGSYFTNDDSQMTVGCDFAHGTIPHENLEIKAQIWTVLERIQSDKVRSMYFKGARVGIFVFDRTRPDTLTQLPKWIEYYQKYCDVGFDNCVVTVVENKIDLPSAIDKNRIEKQMIEIQERFELCQDRFSYYQTSILDKSGVDEIFRLSCKTAVDQLPRISNQ